MEEKKEKKKKSGRSRLLLIAAVLSTLYTIYLISYFGGAMNTSSSMEALGAGLAAAIGSDGRHSVRHRHGPDAHVLHVRRYADHLLLCGLRPHEETEEGGVSRPVGIGQDIPMRCKKTRIVRKKGDTGLVCGFRPPGPGASPAGRPDCPGERGAGRRERTGPWDA